MSSNIYGRGLSGLLKKGWNEIPGVMGGTVMAIIGFVIGVGSIQFLYKERIPKYKMDYIVYRPDDPRANQPTKSW